MRRLSPLQPSCRPAQPTGLPTHRMSATAPHLLHFEGGNALSPFRAQALLARLRAVHARAIAGVGARHVHWVRCDAAARRAPRADELAALLRYGEPRRRRAPRRAGAS